MTDTRLATILISKRSLFLKYLIHIAAIAVDYRRRLEYQAAAMPKVAAKSVFGPERTKQFGGFRSAIRGRVRPSAHRPKTKLGIRAR